MPVCWLPKVLDMGLLRAEIFVVGRFRFSAREAVLAEFRIYQSTVPTSSVESGKTICLFYLASIQKGLITSQTYLKGRTKFIVHVLLM